MVQGVIIKALSGFYYVAAGDQIVECKARGRFRYDGCSPLVGDRVQLSFDAHGKGRIDAGRAKIAGCLGCNYCFSHEGACVQQDDMQQFYPDLHWADVLVYATPLYCFTYPAQLKAFQDRMFCGIAKSFNIPRVGLLLCLEDKDITAADSLLDTYKRSNAYTHQESIGEVVVNAVFEKGAIAGNSGLEKARELGASLA